MRFVSVTVASCAAIFAIACAAPSEAPSDEAVENIEQTEQPLMNTSGNLLGSVCRACGCNWVARQIDGCTTYRCECDSTEKAECVVNAPGGGSAIVSSPIKYTYTTTTLFASP